MSHLRNRAREIQEKIRDILIKEWDPIGISGIPEARDEYDGYIRDLYILVIRRQPIADIFDFLVWAEGEHMGLAVNKQNTMSVAKLISSIS